MDRRSFLKKAGGFAGAGLCAANLRNRAAWTQTEVVDTPSPMPKLVVVRGTQTKQLLQKGLEPLGGIEKYVKAGNVVVLKPNIAWDRPPNLAANTNPDIVAELARLCLKAGAKQVKVFDRTCNDARRTYDSSGIAKAARDVGADVSFIDDRKFRKMTFPGAKEVTEWEVYGEALDADVLINVPIAKHHSLSKLTLAMKNHFGLLGGRRGLLHQNIDQKIADLGFLLKPHLTVLDATRILKANGPTGGNPGDVQILNTLVLCTDQVAVDSYAATLFDLKGKDLGYVRIAHEMKLGRIYPDEIQATELTL